MRLERMVRGSIAVVVLGAGVWACQAGGNGWTTITPAPTASGASVHVTGVVRHSDLEGGFYTIRGSDSVTYDPINLPQEYQHDGLAVEAEGIRRDVLSIHQVGPMVELSRIRRR